MVIFITAVFDESNLFFLSIFSLVLELYNTGFVPFFRNNFPGLFQDFSRLRIDFSRTPKFTLTLSKFYYFIQFNRFPGPAVFFQDFQDPYEP